MKQEISFINFNNNEENTNETEKVIIMEELDIFKSISEFYSYKSDLTNESFTVTFSTNLQEETKPKINSEPLNENKIDLHKVEIISNCSSEDSFRGKSSSFCYKNKDNSRVQILDSKT